MTLTSHRPCFADTMSLPVKYHGQNFQGYHMFANGGGPLVTDLYPDLDEPVKRWGNRIETGDRTMQYSESYRAGLEAATARKPFAPVASHGKQAVLEYGTGYICGMLERGDEPPQPEAKLEPPEPVLPNGEAENFDGEVV